MAPALNLPAPSRGADNTLASSSSTPSFASGGIIFPPPELRRTIDKAAELIAKKDPSFEASIKATELNNPKFAFLSETDAYHAYYVSRREAFRRGETLTAAPESSSSSHTAAVKQQDRQAQSTPEEPEPFDFSADMPNITAFDLDILKLTALFTARRGQSFASALLAKESNSFQYEFLRPSHSLYAYYCLLVQQYQQIISPRPQLLDRIKVGAYGSAAPSTHSLSQTGPGKAGGRPALLEQGRKRAEWEKWTRDKRRKADEDQQQERAAFDEIDWQDFVIVGSVELTETDQHVDLPPPRSLREMENMTMAQKRMASMIMENETITGDGREEVEEVQMPGSRPPPVEQVVQTAGGQNTTIKVRRDYVPRGIAGRNQTATGTGTKVNTTKCPVCGEEVPLDDMAEHVRFELLNPQYREQRQQLEAKKAQQNQLQAGADPSYYLKQLASARTDIFGDKEDEDARFKREAEQRRLAKDKDKITWDGHARSRDAARDLHARNTALEQDMNKLSQKPRVELPEYGPTKPIVPQAQPQSTIQEPGSSEQTSPSVGTSDHATLKRSAAAISEETSELPSKHQKVVVETVESAPAAVQALAKKEDGSLYPEKVWLEGSPSSKVTLVLAIQQDGAERQETYEAALKSTIATLREYVHQDLLSSAIPASKIKIKAGTKATTLKQTLAHWNLSDGDTLTVNITA